MIKPILKTLTFSFATLALAAVVAAEQAPATDRGASTDSTRFGCAPVFEIDLGWEEQIQQVEKRQAEEGLDVKGAIIAPPFETFAPYRTDLPPIPAAASVVKSGKRRATAQSIHD